MEVERSPLNSKELQELEKPKKAIEQASTDNVISKSERERIVSLMRADGKVTPDELRLIREMIHEKVQAGELSLDYSI